VSYHMTNWVMNVKLKALLVDDEVPILQNLSRVLNWERIGVEVTGMARNGAEALRILEEHSIDIMLSDIRMPVMDGLTLVREMRSKGMSTAVLLLTGYQEFEYARTALRYGVKDYINKPIHYEMLERTVHDIAEHIRKSRETTEYVEVKEENHARKTAEQLMLQAGHYIKYHLGHDLSIETTAQHLGISSSYFCALFKNHFGITFVEHVTRQRVESAKQLLDSTEISITRIGQSLGYQERRYFTKVFQKYTGMTPSEYRVMAGGSITGQGGTG
jgi:two-component system, response regulator YesN